MANVNLEPLHRFHSYCARFPSEIVETALKRYTKAGESVLDPFCGSGTTLSACLAHGRTVIGADIDVLAGMLSEVKSAAKPALWYAVPRARIASRIARDFAEIGRSWSKNAAPLPGSVWELGSLRLPIPSFPELHYWFPPQLTAALAAVAHAAHQCGNGHFERVGGLPLFMARLQRRRKLFLFIVRGLANRIFSSPRSPAPDPAIVAEPRAR